jgi:D-alanyl-D-alanine carboxypeptidase
MKFRKYIFLSLIIAVVACTNQVLDNTIITNITSFLDKTPYVNASYRIDHGDKTLLRDAKGFFDLETKKPLTADHQMPIASGTKQMSAAMVLRLQERGILSLEDTMQKFLSEDSGFWNENKYPEWISKITIHNLLTHTTGLTEYIPVLKFDAKKTHEEINKEISKFASSNELKFEPGSKYDYCNTNYFYIGLILESALKKDLATIFKDEIFDPLEMNNTHLANLDEAIKFQNDEIDYLPRWYFGIPTGAEPKSIPAKKDFFLVPFADGGVVSNVDDLVKWNKAFHNGKVVSENSYKLMTTEYYDAVDSLHNNIKMGYGVYIANIEGGKKAYYHSGRAYGIRSEHGYIPQDNVYYGVLSNLMLYETPDIAGSIDYSNQNNKFDISFFKNAIWESVSEKNKD